MKKGISIFYYLSAAYDGLLGIAFLLAPLSIYNWYGITPPNHVEGFAGRCLSAAGQGRVIQRVRTPPRKAGQPPGSESLETDW
jgi:hypothetical protein